jgi:mannitol-1-phosphate/altronate dehydrogenase
MEISPYGGSFKLPIGTVLKIRSATPGKRDAGKKPWSQISFDNPWQDGEQTYGSILHLSDESSKSLSRSIRSGVTNKL